MRLNFCTLFNVNYLSRGLATYESIQRQTKNFHLYIYAFDEIVPDIIRQLNLQNVTVVSLNEFESPELLQIKSQRTAVEYCWTCTPSIIKHAIQQYNLDHCTYIDADLYFYADPYELIEEVLLSHKSVLITNHNYDPAYDKTQQSGKYCVQFLYFKNDTKGMAVLEWWRLACNEWCFNRFEDGKFGDQKYLDDWPTRFDCVHELENPGGGVAVWNLNRFRLSMQGGTWSIKDKFNRSQKKLHRLNFFHFHGLVLFADKSVLLSPIFGYCISPFYLKNFYFPYIRTLWAWDQKVKELNPSINSNGAKERHPNLVEPSFKYKLVVLKDSLKSFKMATILLTCRRITSRYLIQPTEYK